MSASRSIIAIAFIFLVVFAAVPASAHFGTLIPSNDIIGKDDP